MKVRLHNTLTGKVQPLSPSTPGEVRLYSCGPTVYTYTHVGNLRTYIFSDALRRALRSAGFRVRHVMSVTDVGHLQSDADEGEDKMALAANREARSPWQIARFYEDRFFEDCDRCELLLHRQAELLFTIAGVAILEARMRIVYGSRDCRSAREQRQGYHERGHCED